MGGDHIQVAVRVRPPLERELRGALGVPFVATVNTTQAGVSVTNHLATDDRVMYSFSFDRVFNEEATQRDVFDTTARPVVHSCLQGYNATIFAYGQTGAGKTYTMEGVSDCFEDRGITPRAIEQIFTHIQDQASAQNRFLVRCSYLQIYNDVIYDLLDSEGINLAIREEDRKKENSKGVYVEGLTEWTVRSPQEIFSLMAKGAALRATGKTKLNKVSSRSHAILKLIVEQCETTCMNLEGEEISFDEFEKLLRLGNLGGKSPEELVRQSFRVAKLNLVDLAGSERVRVSGATGMRFEECKKINRSLSALGNVISALTDENRRSHVPYRDSKLTRILEDSLGGNCKTTIIANVSPALDAVSETISTLKFANRAKNICNDAHVNEDLDKNSLLRKYQKELKKLRKELEQRSKNVVDQRVVLELEDQKRRAEADKVAALRALESRSFEFMKEKREKKLLESKIAELESQIVVGGYLKDEMLENTPQFRLAINETREKIRAQYKEKMIDLEKERELIEAQKAQAGRYKQLLLKQRDIMVALTQRLNERDDQIVTLQDELDENRRAQATLEERLDEKTTELIHLRRVVTEQASAGQTAKSAGAQQNLARHDSGRSSSFKSVTKEDQERDSMTSVGRGNSPQLRLESRVRALTSQYHSFRDEMTDRLGKKDDQLREVLEENAKLKLLLDKGSIVDGEERGQREELEGKERRGGPSRLGEPIARDEEYVDEMEKLRLRSVNHAKEQMAMRTIMEKVNLLVLNISSSSGHMDESVLPHVRALSNLVGAAVSALSSPGEGDGEQ